MRLKSTFSVFLSISAAASAQTTACRTQPGAPLGVVSYSCASCGIQKSADAPPTTFFGSEPIVTEGVANGPYKSGDIITAVNGNPITTREGSQAFATPMPGKNAVGFRRSEDGA